MSEQASPFQAQSRPTDGYRFPVSVIMECRQIKRGRLSVPSWEATGIVAGEHLGDGVKKTAIHSDDQCQQYLWTGLTLEFFRDASESYWHNLQGSQPSLFVICQEEEQLDSVQPFIVTADQHEADAYLEAEGMVYAVPIPPDLYQWLEQYVISHYQPSDKKKRKRERRMESEQDGEKPARGRPH